jgi:hypothetical protein
MAGLVLYRNSDTRFRIGLFICVLCMRLQMVSLKQVCLYKEKLNFLFTSVKLFNNLPDIPTAAVASLNSFVYIIYKTALVLSEKDLPKAASSHMKAAIN